MMNILKLLRIALLFYFTCDETFRLGPVLQLEKSILLLFANHLFFNLRSHILFDIVVFGCCRSRRRIIVLGVTFFVSSKLTVNLRFL